MNKKTTSKSKSLKLKNSQRSMSRRKFLAATAASVGGAAAIGFPAISRAEAITLRFQSTWPTKDIFHEYALDMDANMLLAWYEYGGGKALYDELQRDVMKLDVEGFLYGPMPTQPLGWFKKQVKSSKDLKGMKFRTVGLSVDVFQEMGAAVVAMPGGEIVPSIQTGKLEAAEFNNASSDRLLGFPDVSKICMLQSYHQPLECFEILFNKQRYDSMPADLKSVIRHAAQASSADMSWKAIDRYSNDYLEMKTKQGVKFYKTPTEILQAQLKAWDKVIAKKSSENPFFAKVIESQKKFAERAVPWAEDTIVSPTLAYNHYFKKG